MRITSIEGKTIYDLCKDKEVLDFITNTPKLSREEYLKGKDRLQIICDLRMLAFITGDEELDMLAQGEYFLLIDWEPRVWKFALKYKESHGIASSD